MANYNKEQVNPFTKKWEVTGVANLTELDAETLNDTTNHSGVRYVLAEVKEEVRLIEIEGLEFNQADVIKSYNDIKDVTKLRSNTGTAKVLSAVNELEEEVRASLLDSLTE